MEVENINIKRAIDKTLYSLKNLGFKGTVRKITDKLFGKKEDILSLNVERYKIWLKNNKLTDEEIESQRKFNFTYSPKFSIVVPLYNTKVKYLEELINSIAGQTYTNFELCLADGSEEENSESKNVIDKYSDSSNSFIKYKFIGKNLGISGNTNEALKMATGEYTIFTDHDDLLPVNALYEIASVLNKDNSIDFIYTDEDKIDDNGNRFDPHFKPDFSKELLECTNYITHLVVAKKELCDSVGFLDSTFDGAQDFDYVLRLISKAKNIHHISKILYHWRVAETSTAKDIEIKSYAIDAGKNALNKYFKENYEGEITAVGCPEVPGVYKLEYKLDVLPKVSIVIPNKDNIKILDRALKSIIKLTTYKNYEIIIVENNSTEKSTFNYYSKIEKEFDFVKVVKCSVSGFNYSTIINCGVKSSTGEYILQLNNDVKLLSPNWLESMIGLMLKSGVGAVGGRLYYEDLSIQHAGISYGISGTAGNMLVNLPKGRHAYLGFEACQRNVSAVTGACLMTTKKIYEEVGYMDEDLAVAFNDVDFCLKIREKGYRIVYNPWVEFIHYESKSRGYEDTPEKKERFEKEKNIFINKWKVLLDENKDPYLNINFSRDYVDYIIKEEKVGE